MGIKLSNERYEEIKEIITELFIKYDVVCVPVNGFKLAAKMGIKVVPYSAIPKSKRWLLLKKVMMAFVLKKTRVSGLFIIMTQKNTVA